MIRFVEETGSTNADLAQALRSQTPPSEGEWLVAKRQTAGKGRQGREWFDGSGNFMGSCVVTLNAGDPLPASLSFVAAMAVYDAAAQVLPDADTLRLKWPNDAVLDGGKLSGILLELVGDSIVAGIGVNLAKAPDLPDRKTSALCVLAGPIELTAFAQNLAASFAHWLSEWREHGLAPLLSDFLERSVHASGSSVTVHDTDGTYISGTFAGLEESDGALRLRLADGSERVIRAGDIA
ncbi:MAG: biotin--[acetyl-CoA-carboxylase] ligase [Erythrobacter sp.]|uniref:biotin--[acetyl-CoA-carboxylase] ligase n=1 Tax=Erythrobacter sp. TaxID=1042 RepID=UPI003267647B